MTDKFRVSIPYYWPEYFENFLKYCTVIAEANDWQITTTINYQLKPHGRFIQTKTQGAYLRWDNEKYHTEFVLRYS